MDGREETKKKIINKASYIGVFFSILWVCLIEYCRFAPIYPDESIGRIYPMNYHGDVVYLNGTENFLMYFLPGAGFFVVFSLAFFDQYGWNWLVNLFNKK